MSRTLVIPLKGENREERLINIGYIYDIVLALSNLRLYDGKMCSGALLGMNELRISFYE